MAPPSAAAPESTSSSSRVRGSSPRSFRSPPLRPTATALPIVSKKSAMNSAKMTGISATVSASARADGASASPIVEKSAEPGMVDDRARPREDAEDQAEPRGGEHTEDDRAADAPGDEHDGHGDPAESDQRRPLREVAERDAGRRVVDHDAALAQADERDEQPDPDADGELERQR